MQNESEHQFLQRDFFFLIIIFKYERLGTKRENGKEEQGELFSSSSMPMGGMQIHWFKLVTSCRR